MRESRTRQRRHPHLRPLLLRNFTGNLGWTNSKNATWFKKRTLTLGALLREVQVCNFQSQFLGIDIGAVGKHNDCHFVVPEIVGWSCGIPWCPHRATCVCALDRARETSQNRSLSVDHPETPRGRRLAART